MIDYIPIMFSLLTLVVFALPTVPAWIELIAKTDATPLPIAQSYDTNPAYFASGFKRYLWDRFPSIFSHNAPVESRSGALQDGTVFQITSANDSAEFNSTDHAKGEIQRLLLSRGTLKLPADMVFMKEIYSTRSVKGGDGNFYRAVLAEEDVELAEQSTVSRWVHAGNSVSAKPGSALYGRVSAGRRLMISKDCSFERLHAPIMQFGPLPPRMQRRVERKDLSRWQKLRRVSQRHGAYWWINGNVEIPLRSLFIGNIIATGNVTIGEAAHIDGNIKCFGELRTEERCVINGSLVSPNYIHIGADSEVLGPLISEGHVFVENGAVIGNGEHPTTINAQEVTLLEGALVFGSIWAHTAGHVEAGERA